MSATAISIRGLSKTYRLGQREHYRTIRDTVASMLRKVLSGAPRVTPSNKAERFLALDSISCEIRAGEVVGIVGRNGAGKSTLLKVLSRITTPTAGQVEIEGRVGSLLEVGTGFHPELTGRENIFLNAAILGMSRSDVLRRLDDIIDFAEISAFLDTPVKRYSSGMYMRLAFSVAAHLEPDILVVDEVLAVGDIAFQRKCLGKMGSVARTGRTVLFVSHNMEAVSQLTSRCLWLNEGRCILDGPTPEVLRAYLNGDRGGDRDRGTYMSKSGVGGPHIASVKVRTSQSVAVHRWGEPITFEFTLASPVASAGLRFSFQVVDEQQRPICHFRHFESGAKYQTTAGETTIRCIVPKFRAYLGRYTLTTWFADRRSGEAHENLVHLCPFEVVMYDVPSDEYGWQPQTATYIEDHHWVA